MTVRARMWTQVCQCWGCYRLQGVVVVYREHEYDNQRLRRAYEIMVTKHGWRWAPTREELSMGYRNFPISGALCPDCWAAVEQTVVWEKPPRKSKLKGPTP